MQTIRRMATEAVDMAKKILIVEDDGNIEERLKIQMRVEGYDTSHAAEGKKGSELMVS